MKITFYKNISSDNTINKSLSLVHDVIECVVKQPISIINPIVTIEYNSDINKNCNYVYIEDFNRYYYVTDMQPLTGSRLQIELKVDVLMSFKTQILSLPCIVDKQQSIVSSNKYKDDGSFVTLNKSYDTIYNFSGGFNNAGTFVLICAGGKGGIV